MSDAIENADPRDAAEAGLAIGLLVGLAVTLIAPPGGAVGFICIVAGGTILHWRLRD